MSDVYQKCFYHIVWTTKRREAMILPRSEALLFEHIRHKCAEKKAFVYALGGLTDHVHLLCSIPAHFAVADFVGAIKGSVSHYMNHHPQADPVYWQRGYSYHTFSKRDLVATVAYVRDQKKRHAEDRLWPELERVPDEDGDSGNGGGRRGPLGTGGGPGAVLGSVLGGLTLLVRTPALKGRPIRRAKPLRGWGSLVGDHSARACRGAARDARFSLSSGAERLFSSSRPAF